MHNVEAFYKTSELSHYQKEKTFAKLQESTEKRGHRGHRNRIFSNTIAVAALLLVLTACGSQSEQTFATNSNLQPTPTEQVACSSNTLILKKGQTITDINPDGAIDANTGTHYAMVKVGNTTAFIAKDFVPTSFLKVNATEQLTLDATLSCQKIGSEKANLITENVPANTYK